MTKSKITILTLFLLLSGLVLSGCVPKNQEVTNSDQVGSQEEIDTSDWKTYRNEEYGFEFKYPEGWEVAISDGQVLVSYSGWRAGVPEGGSVLSIKAINTSLSQFIEDYNKSDEFSKIIDQSDYLIDGKMATKLTGSTAIGIDSNFLFINKSDKYVIFFHDFDQDHLKILSTFEFID